MNKLLNLSQSPENIATEAKNFYWNNLDQATKDTAIEMAIYLIENMLAICPEKTEQNVRFWSIDYQKFKNRTMIADNPKFLSLSSALEILKQESK